MPVPRPRSRRPSPSHRLGTAANRVRPLTVRLEPLWAGLGRTTLGISRIAHRGQPVHRHRRPLDGVRIRRAHHHERSRPEAELDPRDRATRPEPDRHRAPLAKGRSMPSCSQRLIVLFVTPSRINSPRRTSCHRRSGRDRRRWECRTLDASAKLDGRGGQAGHFIAIRWISPVDNSPRWPPGSARAILGPDPLPHRAPLIGVHPAPETGAIPPDLDQRTGNRHLDQRTGNLHLRLHRREPSGRPGARRISAPTRHTPRHPRRLTR